jgi:hypothetical protein
VADAASAGVVAAKARNRMGAAAIESFFIGSPPEIARSGDIPP